MACKRKSYREILTFFLYLFLNIFKGQLGTEKEYPNFIVSIGTGTNVNSARYARIAVIGCGAAFSLQQLSWCMFRFFSFRWPEI